MTSGDYIERAELTEAVRRAAQRLNETEEDGGEDALRWLYAELRREPVADATELGRAQRRILQEPHRKDHACSQCVPDGEIVQPGFVCVYHVALAAAAKSPADCPVEPGHRWLVADGGTAMECKHCHARVPVKRTRVTCLECNGTGVVFSGYQDESAAVPVAGQADTTGLNPVPAAASRADDWLTNGHPGECGDKFEGYLCRLAKGHKGRHSDTLGMADWDADHVAQDLNGPPPMPEPTVPNEAIRMLRHRSAYWEVRASRLERELNELSTETTVLSTAADLQRQEIAQVRTESAARVAHLELTEKSVRMTLSTAGHCGDGNLPAMVKRALEEAKQEGRDEMAEVSRAMTDASAALPEDSEGTIAERIQRLRDEIEITDWLLAERNRLLDLFDCEAHGPGCVPNAIEEVKRLRHAEKKICAARSHMLNRSSYEFLLNLDLKWLREQPDCLERSHIEVVLAATPDLLYGPTKPSHKPSDGG